MLHDSDYVLLFMKKDPKWVDFLKVFTVSFVLGYMSLSVQNEK